MGVFEPKHFWSKSWAFRGRRHRRKSYNDWIYFLFHLTSHLDLKSTGLALNSLFLVQGHGPDITFATSNHGARHLGTGGPHPEVPPEAVALCTVLYVASNEPKFVGFLEALSIHVFTKPLLQFGHGLGEKLIKIFCTESLRNFSGSLVHYKL